MYVSMDPRVIVQRYAQLKQIRIEEFFNIYSNVYSITLHESDEPIKLTIETATTKQDAKVAACATLLESYPRIREIGTSERKSIREIYLSKPGIDYIEYSRQTVLQNIRIHWNDESFFENDHIYDIVSFDSEGRPLRLVQFCCNMTDVYLFELPRYQAEVIRLMENNHIKKIVCDIRSEESSLGITIHNYVDIQPDSKKSLTSLIEDITHVKLKKNKTMHIIGWNGRLTKNQIDYAAADALWTYKCYIDR